MDITNIESSEHARVSVPESETVQRVWKWYLILVIVYYILNVTCQLAAYTGIDLNALFGIILRFSMFWGIFNLGVCAFIINSNIEKKALVFPIIGMLPFLIPFGALFSPFDFGALFFAIYLLARK